MEVIPTPTAALVALDVEHVELADRPDNAGVASLSRISKEACQRAHHGLVWLLRDALVPRMACQGSMLAFWSGIFSVADL